MKHSIFTKFIAIALCAAALLTIAGSTLSIVLLTEMGLYDKSVQEVYAQRLEGEAYSCAQQIAQNYASVNLGGCPEEMIGNFFFFNAGYYGYTLKDAQGNVLETVNPDQTVNSEDVYRLVLPVSGSYMKVVNLYHWDDPVDETRAAEESFVRDDIGDEDSVVYGFVVSNGDESSGIDSEDPLGLVYHGADGTICFDSLEPFQFDLPQGIITGITFYNVHDDEICAINSGGSAGMFYYDTGGCLHFVSDTAAPSAGETESYDGMIPAATVPAVAADGYRFSYYDAAAGHEVTVVYVWDVMPEYTVTMTLLPGASNSEDIFTLATMLAAYQDAFPVLLIGGLLMFAITVVYLCCAAGRSPGTDEIRLVGLNRIPLDLYLAADVLLLGLLAIACLEGGRELFRGKPAVGLGVAAITGYLMCLLAVGFGFAFAAQAKIKGGYWWRHSATGWALRQIGRFLRWIGRGFGFLGRGCRAVFGLLPVIWQWLLIAAAMGGSVVIFLLLFLVTGGYVQLLCLGMLMLCVLACVAVVCYGSFCYGTLMKGAKAMAQGELNHQIPTRYMAGSFKDFAIRLNSLAGGARIAAEKQLKSERMKTELITNVSHDIKTPLTSIINFVDLLKKPHTEEEGEQYLEVLDRQSQRLKKLIDDLMEMSKASTGNLSVELGQVDAAEAVNQALGEFADKLDAARLTPVFRYPDTPVTMLADGRLVWRVLSNLLSNAVKYALPDTRLYIDLMVLQGNAVIAVKNISRDQLNVNADELMERFIRGDTSRNTEGSGLGLNIAKSLVELQKGQMHLMVDGDLFKVTLIFPMA